MFRDPGIKTAAPPRTAHKRLWAIVSAILLVAACSHRGSDRVPPGTANEVCSEGLCTATPEIGPFVVFHDWNSELTKSITIGPGENNDLIGKDGWVMDNFLRTDQAEQAVPAGSTADSGSENQPALPSLQPTALHVARTARTWCDITRSHLETSECDELRAQLTHRTRREIIFRAHPRMRLGAIHPVVVRVRIPRGSEPSAEPSIAEGRAMARFTRHMAARLTGAGFDISPVGWHSVDGGFNVEAAWRWNVTPRQEGENTLEVEVIPVLRRANGEEIQADRFGAELRVKVVTPPAPITEEAKGFLDSWTGVLGSFAVFITALLGAFAAMKQLLGWKRKSFDAAPAPAN